MEVVDLEEGDLIMTLVSRVVPPPSQYPRDVLAELPAGVNQFWTNSQAISPDIAVNLRNRLDG